MKTAQDCSHWRKAIRAWVGEGVAGEQTAQIQNHLACCEGCQKYAEELRTATAGLRWLADRPVEPSPGFRARWMRAVEAEAEPRSFGETAAALAAWWRDWVLRNLRPAAAVASLWILALLFRLSAPEVAPTAETAVARSPIEIYRVLKAEQQLLAGELGQAKGIWVAPRNEPPARPRSEGLPTEPAAQREQLSIATANV